MPDVPTGGVDEGLVAIIWVVVVLRLKPLMSNHYNYCKCVALPDEMQSLSHSTRIYSHMIASDGGWGAGGSVW